MQRHCATQLFFVVSVVLLLQACSGGSCGRREVTIDDIEPAPEREQPTADEILGAPVTFDVQSVDEALQALSSGRDLDAAEVARIIVENEAAITHLSMTVQRLVINEDNADTWHVFNDIRQEGWAAKTVRIVELLEELQLDESQSGYVEQMRHAIDQLQAPIAVLRSQVRNLPDIEFRF